VVSNETQQSPKTMRAGSSWLMRELAVEPVPTQPTSSSLLMREKAVGPLPTRAKSSYLSRVSSKAQASLTSRASLQPRCPLPLQALCRCCFHRRRAQVKGRAEFLEDQLTLALLCRAASCRIESMTWCAFGDRCRQAVSTQIPHDETATSLAHWRGRDRCPPWAALFRPPALIELGRGPVTLASTEVALSPARRQFCSHPAVADTGQSVAASCLPARHSGRRTITTGQLARATHS
jgi:hypothetical protein